MCCLGRESRGSIPCRTCWNLLRRRAFVRGPFCEFNLTYKFNTVCCLWTRSAVRAVKMRIANHRRASSNSLPTSSLCSPPPHKDSTSLPLTDSGLCVLLLQSSIRQARVRGNSLCANSARVWPKCELRTPPTQTQTYLQYVQYSYLDLPLCNLPVSLPPCGRNQNIPLLFTDE